jgi:hypothetical protein
MARLSPTPVCGGYRSAGSFTQLQAALSGTSRGSAWTIQPAPLRLCYSDPDVRSLAIMVASAATTPQPRSFRGGACLSFARHLSLMRRKIRCALDRQLLQTLNSAILFAV